IAEGDGHKDYKTIESEDKRKIISISPNPSNANTTVSYLIGEQDNAMLQFTHSVYASHHNYFLDNETDELALTTVGWTPGLYVVNLVVNGVIIDTKNLLIN
ncbi:MAG: hypothetical protein LAT51_06710, partial [Flavobacteriaceae bacterium]|nr:hypothetical protein [Flavobacteriaceae bacterium]